MSTSLTPPKLGNKQLDSEPESADKAKKYPEQRNNATPQLFITDDLAKKRHASAVDCRLENRSQN